MILITNGATFSSCTSLGTNLVLAGGSYRGGYPGGDLFGPVLWTGGSFTNASNGYGFYNYATLTLAPGGQTGLAPGAQFEHHSTLSGGTLRLESNSGFNNLGVVRGVNLMPGASGSGEFRNQGLFTPGLGTATNVVGAIFYDDTGGSNDCGDGVLLFGSANNFFGGTKFTGSRGMILITNGATFSSCTSLGTNLVLAGGLYRGGYPGGDLFGPVLWTGGSFTNASNGYGFYNYATLTLALGGQTGLAAGAYFENHGALRGSGMIFGTNAAVDNFGLLSPGAPVGPLTLSANLYESASGTLQVVLGGYGTNEFGNLVVNGTVSLDGALQASLTNGFVPLGGAQFRILSAPSRTGTFSSLNIPQNMVPVYDSTGVSLVVTGSIPVQITRATSPASEINVSFGTVNGFTYTVQTNQDLRTANWGLYTNIIGNGWRAVLVLPTTEVPENFIRVTMH